MFAFLKANSSLARRVELRSQSEGSHDFLCAQDNTGCQETVALEIVKEPIVSVIVERKR